MERARWLAARRHDGTVLDTRTAVMEFGVRAELGERGWDRAWPAAPGEVSLAGRWPGSRDGGWPERVAASLPADLVEKVRAACWTTSEPAIIELRAWRDEHPNVVITSRSENDAAALAVYDEFAARVTVPGEIWRAAIARTLPPEEITGTDRQAGGSVGDGSEPG